MESSNCRANRNVRANRIGFACRRLKATNCEDYGDCRGLLSPRAKPVLVLLAGSRWARVATASAVERGTRVDDAGRVLYYTKKFALVGGLTRVIRILAVCPIAGMAGLGALLGAVWLEHRAPITLPEPTGAYPVGRAIVDWKDDHPIDSTAPVPGTARELLASIWYPAAAQPGAVIDDYIPAASVVAADRLRSHALPARLMNHVLTRDLSNVHAHSAAHPAVASQERSYPVLILRGGASAPVATYTTLAEDLASHGYVVVGIDAPFRTTVVAFPDGRAFARAPENNPELWKGGPSAASTGCSPRGLATSAWRSIGCSS